MHEDVEVSFEIAQRAWLGYRYWLDKFSVEERNQVSPNDINMYDPDMHLIAITTDENFDDWRTRNMSISDAQGLGFYHISCNGTEWDDLEDGMEEIIKEEYKKLTAAFWRLLNEKPVVGSSPSSTPSNSQPPQTFQEWMKLTYPGSLGRSFSVEDMRSAFEAAKQVA